MQLRNKVLQKGMSMVELLIVVTIMGLLLAAVLSGVKLLEQTKLNSVLGDFQRYRIAFNSYYDYYKLFPGDDNKAFARWGTTCGADATNCNGDADGKLSYAAAVGSLNESIVAWKHLALGGFIPNVQIKVYSASDPATMGHSQHLPTSNITRNAAYFFADDVQKDSVAGGAGTLFEGKVGIFIGKFPGGGLASTNTTANNAPAEAALTGSQATYIATKMGDETPAFGAVRATASQGSPSTACWSDSSGVTIKGGSSDPTCLVGLQVVHAY